MKNTYKTKAREVILAYLKEHTEQRLTAREIYEAVRVEDAENNRSTVYRNLERLVNDGSLIKYKEADVDATCYRYSEHNGSCNDHLHAQCTGCGKVFHLKNSVLGNASNKIKSEYGIDIDYGKTVIIGVCDKCRKKKK